MGVNAWSGVSKNASTQRVMYISGVRATESLDCVVYTIACIGLGRIDADIVSI